MTSQEIIKKLKQDREEMKSKSKSDYVIKMHEIRKQIALNSLKEVPDMELYSNLIKKLEELKMKQKETRK